MADNTYARCERLYSALEDFEEHVNHKLSRDLLPLTRPVGKKMNLENVAYGLKRLLRTAGELYIAGDCIEGVLTHCKAPVKDEQGEPRLRVGVLGKEGVREHLLNPNNGWVYRHDPTTSGYILVDCESKTDGRPRIPIHIVTIEGNVLASPAARRDLVERLLLLEATRHIWRRGKKFE